MRKLQLGAGPSILPGWLTTDLRPRRAETAKLDVTSPFPVPDESIDFIAAEHVIEHISFDAGQAMVRECRRVLKPEGRIRVSTPDLRQLALAYLGQAGCDGEAYKCWSLERHLGRDPADDSAFVLNHHVRAWGHTFLYDEKTLVPSFGAAGFIDVSRQQFDVSPTPELANIERHGSGGGARRQAAVRFERLIVEASKHALSDATDREREN